MTLQNGLKFLAILISLSVSTTLTHASELDQKLSQTGKPYIKYFKDRAVTTTDFLGLTNSFQIDLGGHDAANKAVIDHGAMAYDQSLLARISLAGGTTTILDTYVAYSTPSALQDVNNPLLKCSPGFTDGSGNPIKYGPYRAIRISGRDEPYWYTTWDWNVDTGASACLIIDSLEAYQKTSNAAYKNFAILQAAYIKKLQDSDGGIRYGPVGMYHPSGSYFYWDLKSTEQNERCLYAFQALYSVTGDSQYNTVAENIKLWLKSMYNFGAHMFHASASFDGLNWVKSEIYDYVPTDVTAFAPLEMMFSDTYFGQEQATRDAEVDAMFSAIEARTAFMVDSKPVFFRFSLDQSGDYGSVEWSAQMAISYLAAAQNYLTRDASKAQFYFDRYNAVISFLDTFFSLAPSDADSKIAPYASYYPSGAVAGNVKTGTGYYTVNCQAALASACYVFAKAGYNPAKLGGGPGNCFTMDLIDVPWYQNANTYVSTGAAACQMIINYMRKGTTQLPITDQNLIYQYALGPSPYGPDLAPNEISKALGHFDPYDIIVSNWADSYDSLIGGNPYQGYNFGVPVYDPQKDANALNNYMRDICHWMAYTVTQEDWWKDGPLVAQPNTPAAIPIYGNYNHWVTVKGFVSSLNPCPQPRTNPWYAPDFTVYGFWLKDPSISGIGKDTYKTAAECASTYFLPLATSDNYNGKFVQVAEPPSALSNANVNIAGIVSESANLAYIGVNSALRPTGNVPIVKKDWRDILPAQLLLDADCQASFNGSVRGNSLFVKRVYMKDSDYYLIPFNKRNNKGQLLTSGVIIIDGQDGSFKEASWSKTPEKFLKVNKQDAIMLIRNYIQKYFSDALMHLPRTPRKDYFKQADILRKTAAKLLSWVRYAKADLFWDPSTDNSLSPYQPYWELNTNGYVWVVTQDARVIPKTSMDK